jgi:hypothetical protein
MTELLRIYCHYYYYYYYVLLTKSRLLYLIYVIIPSYSKALNCSHL